MAAPIITQSVTREIERTTWADLVWISGDLTLDQIAEGLAADEYSYDFHQRDGQEQIDVVDDIHGVTVARLEVTDENESEFDESINEEAFKIEGEGDQDEQE